MLSAINLVGGVQRRRTHEDELNMRTYFSENDIISSEVQTVLNDGTVALHTRNTKYGKVGRVYGRPASDILNHCKYMLEGLSMFKQLQYGQLVRVYPNLVKRLKQHFSTLKECGNIGMIIGCNGYIWIVSASDQTKQKRKQR